MIPFNYALELTGHTGAEVTTLYFSSLPALVTGASDTPPATTFIPRIIQPGNYKVDAFDTGATFGASRVGFGEITLDNTDGALDYLVDYGFDGRPVVLRTGLPGAAYPTGYKTIYTATVEQISFDWDKIIIRLRDNLAKLQIPLPQSIFAGDNILPLGLEGVAADLKGKNKPIVIGSVFNIQPPCCNTSKLIYCLSSGLAGRLDTITDWDAISDFDGMTNIFGNTGEGIDPATIHVFDKGVELAKGADYSDEGELLANAPVAGQFRLFPGGPNAYIRLGSAPAGIITCDCTDKSGVTPLPGSLIRRFLEMYLLWPSGSWNQSELDVLDAAAPYALGLYLNDQPINADQLLDLICNSVGACYSFDNAGILRVFQVAIPTAPVDLALTGLDIDSITRKSTSDPGNGIPAWQVRVRYGKNYTVQPDLAGGADISRVSAIKDTWRESLATDETIKIKYLLSPALVFETCLVNEPIAETARRLAIYKYKRDRLELVMKTSQVDISKVRIGAVTSLDLAGRYGYDGSQKLLLLGIATDVARDKLVLTVWG